MAGQSNIEKIGRFDYVEPMNMYLDKPDNTIVYNPEDYNISVNLEVEIPSRFYYENNEVKLVASSDNGSISFFGGTNVINDKESGSTERGYLTTSWTDISVNNVDSGNKECLGIESINIAYSPNFFPIVTIRFVDVRGASLFAAQQRSYEKWVETKGYDPKNAFDGASFFKALFSMPSPIFKLTVKGFYGKPVTYKLIMSKFSSDFDSDSGNFIANVEFAGYMYGIYTELPMSFIALAPYLDDMQYWKEKQFCFDSGVLIPTIPELIEKIGNAPKDAEQNTLQSKQGQEYQDSTKLLNILQEVKNKFPFKASNGWFKSEGEFSDESVRGHSFNGNVASKSLDEKGDYRNKGGLVGLNDVRNCGGEKNKKQVYYCIKEGRDYGTMDWTKNEYIDLVPGATSDFISSFTVIGSNGVNEYLDLLKKLVETGGSENYKRFNEYLEDFKLILEYSDYYVPVYIDGVQKNVCIPIMCFVNYFNGSQNGIYGVNFWNDSEKKTHTIFYSGFKISNGVDCNINDIKDIYQKGNKTLTPNNGDKVIYRIISNIPTWVDEDIEKLTKDVKEKTDELYKQKIVEEQKLIGFPLTIKNFYDIIFAHIDTFMNRFYEHLKNLSEDNNRKRLLTSRASDICDVPSKIATKKVPPFPTFISKTTEKDEIVWPPVVLNGENYEETHFVYEIINAALQLSSGITEAQRAIAEHSKRTMNNYPIGTEGMLPATPYDLVFGKKQQKNPYQEIYDEYVTGSNSTDALKKIWFVFMCRCAYFALMFRKYRTIVKTSDSTTKSEELNKSARAYFAMCEVCNIVKVFGDNLGNLKNTLIKTEDFEKFINDYIEGELKTASKKYGGYLNDSNYGWPGVTFKGELKLAKDGEESKYTVIPIQYINKGRLEASKENRTCLIDNDSYAIFEENGHVIENKLDEITLNAGSINLLPEDYFTMYESLIKGDNTIKECLSEEFSENHVDDFIKDLYEVYLGKSVQENFKISNTYKYKGKDLTFTDGENAKKYEEIVKEGIIHSTTISLQEDKKKFTSYINNMACIDPVNVISNGCTRNNSTVHFVKSPTSGIELRFLKDGADNYTKAFLFLFSIPLTKNYMKAASVCNGQKVLDVALLREGAFYYWQENWENIQKQFNKNFGAGMTRDNVPIVSNKTTSGSDAPTLWLEDATDVSYLTWEDLVVNNNKDFVKLPLSLRRVTRIPQNRRMFLINNFKQWAQGEEFNNISLLSPNVSGLTSPEMETVIDLYFSQQVYFDYTDVLEETSYHAPAESTGNTFSEENVNFLIDTYEQFAKYMEIACPQNGVINDAPDAGSVFNLERSVNTSEDLKLSVYLTLQSIYNKFIAASNKERWKFGGEKSEFRNFLYMDSYYNRIDDKIILNASKIENMLSDVTSTVVALTNASGDAYKGSVYEFFARVCQDNGMNLLALPMQPFMVGADKDKPVWDLFTTIPYNRMDLSNETSCFVSMYTYRPSTHLDLQDDGNEYAFINDGFDINVNNEKDLPVSLQSFGNPDAPRIPSFAVTYAKQNQSIFKKINVSTANPQITEPAIAMTLNIASKSDSNPRDSVFFGQDIYSVYSNYSYTCDVEMMGCAPIMPLMYFQLNNIPMFKGAYMIINVEHNIVAGNMTTRFKGVRVSKNAIPFVKANYIYTDDLGNPHYGNIDGDTYRVARGVTELLYDSGYVYNPSPEENERNKERMKYAFDATFTCKRDWNNRKSNKNGEAENWCAWYSYNMAYAYKKGTTPCLKTDGGAVHAGGNANDERFWNNLVALGYKKDIIYHFASTEEIKEYIKNSNPTYGDVYIYQSDDGVKYHAQVYTGEMHGTTMKIKSTKPSDWASSVKNNYGSGFVYNDYNCSWILRIYRANP